MPDTTINRIAVICGLVLLAFQGLAVAQQHTANSTHPVKASIILDSVTFSRQKPNIVTITIENISGRELDLEAISSFEMLSLAKEAMTRKHPVRGDSYWSPVNIVEGTPLGLKIIDPELEKKGVIVGKVPTTSLHFAINETKTFKIDLTKMGWNDSILSGWPAGTGFEVVPAGMYSLRFEIGKRGRRTRSNEVQITLQ